jgi:foldase protein PrsA
MATKTSSKKKTTKSTSPKQTTVQQAPKENKVKTSHSKTALAIIGVIFLFLFGMFIVKNFLIAAFVNGQPISRITIIKELERQAGKQTLDGMITRVLIQQEADKKNIIVGQDEIDGEIKTIEDSLKEQQTTLDAALQLQGMTKDDLIKDIRLQLIVQKLVEEKVKLSDEEVKAYAKENEDFFPEDATEEERIEDAREQLKQQQISVETQKLIDELQKNAKTIYFVSY